MINETRIPSTGGGPTKRTRRRLLPLGIIGFLGVAFVIAAVDGPQGLPSVALPLAVAFALVIVIAYVAFGRSTHNPRQAGLEEFGMPSEGRRPAISERLRENWKVVSEAVPRILPLGTATSPTILAEGQPSLRAAHSEPRRMVKKYVRSIVPVPRIKWGSFDSRARQDTVEALREEAQGLIRLAKVTGIEIEPYRDFVMDARQAAAVGRIDESLHSIALANELLRDSIENSFTKHMQTTREEVGAADA